MKKVIRENLNKQKELDNLNNQLVDIFKEISALRGDVKLLREELSSVKDTFVKVMSDVNEANKNIQRNLLKIEASSSKKDDDLSHQISQITGNLNKATEKSIQRLLLDLKRLRDKEKEEAEK